MHYIKNKQTNKEPSQQRAVPYTEHNMSALSMKNLSFI